MNTELKQKFDSYPKEVAILLKNIRSQILQTAKENSIQDLEETLKWGEPSYLCKSGSTIRFDWKNKYPNQYCIYFNCKTRLVETFKEIYADLFKYEGNRAIVFQLDDVVPIYQLKHCFALSLRYHKIKHLPLLGV